MVTFNWYPGNTALFIMACPLRSVDTKWYKIACEIGECAQPHMPRGRPKKSAQSETSLPNGAMQINFRVEGQCSLCSCVIDILTLQSIGSAQNPPSNKRPARKRRATRKATEDATADVPITAPPSTLNNWQRQDPVIRSPAPADPFANLPRGHQEDRAAAPAHPSPVRDDGANPFLATADLHDTRQRNSTATPSTERRFYAVSPSTPARSPHTPRAGQHSIPYSITRRRRRRQSQDKGPAGHKHRHAARDVWTFFEDNDSKRNCLFCK
jgi:hypothetical protein